MKEVKVSIVVPVYNTEKYLKQCLDSLVNQTLQEIQIIIVDDGSTDSSPEIIAKYQSAHPEKILAIRKENGGQGMARNLALEYCVGEYVGFLDSDDYAKPNMFEEMYTAAKKKNADYVACGYTTFAMKNEQETIIDSYKKGAVYYEREGLLLFHAEVAPWLHLYKNSLIKEKGVRFPEGVIHEDTAFYANCIPYIHSVAQVEKSLVMHRKHEQSTVGKMSGDKVRQIFPVIDAVREWYETKLSAACLQDEQECFSVRILLCSSVTRIAAVDKFSERKALIKETLAYIRKYYPDYKKNPYFKKGLMQSYVRGANFFTVMLVCECKRIKSKIKKKYT